MTDKSEWHASWRIGVGAFILAAAVQIGSSTWPDKIKPHPYVFIAFCLIGVLFIIIPSSKALWSFVLNRANVKKPNTALEIIFEPLNPARRFWSLESYKDSSGKGRPYWEHRVEIRNNSLKTIRNVMVTIERTGQSPQLPFSPPFKRPQADKCDINPGCSELVQVNIWPHPKRQVGMACGESAWIYGPIKVTASGDDTPSVVRIFAFNYETDQMLFDVEVY